MSAPDLVREPRLSGKRVLIVLEGLELAGAERQALLLARHLQRREAAAVEVWTFSKPGSGARLCEHERIPWRLVPVNPRWSRFTLPLVLARFALRLRRASPDVVLPYTLVPNVLCCAGARRSGAALTVWNQRDAGLGRLARRVERFAVRSAGAVVANSRPGATFLESALGVAPTRIRIVPNGVEISEAPRKRASGFSACMVAHLTGSKDHATLLHAFKLVTERIERPASLLLAGRLDAAHPELLRLARDLGIEPHVRFLGEVEDVADLLAGVDLGVHSSRLEGCPNGVLECMAAGLPVAGTDNDGIRDALGEGGAALLAPPGDPTALAERILRAAADPALRARLGEANRARARSEYSVEAMCETMTELVASGLSAP